MTVSLHELMRWKKHMAHRAAELDVPPCVELRVVPELFKQIEAVAAGYCTIPAHLRPTAEITFNGVRIVMDWYGARSLEPGAEIWADAS